MPPASRTPQPSVISRVSFDAGMYFRFGRAARKGVLAKTCFDAVVSRERTSTTRFEEDGRTQYEHWLRCKEGEIVRVWSGPWKGTGFSGRSCLIEVTGAPKAVDIRVIDREAWSVAEGWSPAFLDVLLAKGRTSGVQVRYTLHTAPEDHQLPLF